MLHVWYKLSFYCIHNHNILYYLGIYDNIALNVCNVSEFISCTPMPCQVIYLTPVCKPSAFRLDIAMYFFVYI